MPPSSTTASRSKTTTIGLALAFLSVFTILFLAGEVPAMADASDAGKNFGALLKGWALQLYIGVMAIVSIVFLVNRKYTELLLFVLAALLVGWMVGSPDSVAGAARELGSKIVG